jgi:GxxExxY protein
MRRFQRKSSAAAIAVHKQLGPGFLESIYEEALAIELDHLRIPFERQKPVQIFYRNRVLGEHRLDFLVAKRVVVELKAIQALERNSLLHRSLLSESDSGSVGITAQLCDDAIDSEARWSRRYSPEQSHLLSS